MNELRKILEEFTYKQLLHQFNLAIPDKEEWANTKIIELEFAIRQWAKSKVPEKKDHHNSENLHYRGWVGGMNEVIEETLKNLEEEK